jgi:MFS family permease
MSLLQSLSDKNFRHLFYSRSLSLLGSGIGRVALAFFAYHLAPGNVGRVLGVVLTLNMLAYIIMGPVWGHFAARIPRKLFFISMDVIRLGLLCAMPWLTHVWQVYLWVVLINICSAGYTPLYQAVIPEMLPDEAVYSQALILTRITYNIETLLSPALCALLLLVISFRGLFYINALMYFLAALSILPVTFPSVLAKIKTSGVHVYSGITQYLGNRRLLACLALILISTLAGATVYVNSVGFIHGHFGQSKSATAMAMFMFGLGSIGFALFMPRLRQRFSEQRLMQFGALWLIATFFVASWAHTWQDLYLAWFSLGVGTIAIEGLLGVIVNQFANAQNRATMFAANFSLTHGAWLVGYLTVALLGHGWHLQRYFLLLAGAALALFVLSMKLITKASKK